MAYVYDDVEKLEGTELVGSHQCVALVQHYAKAPQTRLWKEGKTIKGNQMLKKGTAIATFSNGKYDNHRTGNHAALYISQDASGIKVMDQWKGDENKPKVSSRLIRFKGKRKDGTFLDPSNNGDAFAVIE